MIFIFYYLIIYFQMPNIIVNDSEVNKKKCQTCSILPQDDPDDIITGIVICLICGRIIFL
jgi:hypothetical protein